MPDSVIALFDGHRGAARAIGALRTAKVEMTTLSLIGEGNHRAPVGVYSAEDWITYWGPNGAFWGSVCGLLSGSVFLTFPDIRPLLAAGPIAGAIAGAALGGAGAIRTALLGLGVPRDRARRCEASLKAGKFMLVVSGPPETVIKAEAVLSSAIGANPELYLTEMAGVSASNDP